MIYGFLGQQVSREKSAEVFKAIKDESHPRHIETVKWYRAEQAKNLVKKIVVAMDAGFQG